MTLRAAEGANDSGSRREKQGVQDAQQAEAGTAVLEAEVEEGKGRAKSGLPRALNDEQGTL